MHAPRDDLEREVRERMVAGDANDSFSDAVLGFVEKQEAG